MAVTFSQAAISAGRISALYFKPSVTQVGYWAALCLQSDVFMFFREGSHTQLTHQALQARGNNPQIQVTGDGLLGCQMS